MTVYRIAQSDFINDLQGSGARIAGGRWNDKGTPLLYTSSSVSLSILECLVHVATDLLPENLYLAQIEIPDSFNSKTIHSKDLPVGWDKFPAPEILRVLTRQWIKDNKEPVMLVPSAVNPLEQNILVNPLHPQFTKIKILSVQKLSIDKRLQQL